MCRRVECAKCKKPTYAGCGMHIEQVLGDVPREKRCSCRGRPENGAKDQRSLLRRILGL
jgi:hypothetical protein